VLARAGVSRVLTAITAAVAWFALVLQFVLLLGATWNTKGPALATIQFFSYFTILSNLLVALVCTFAMRDAGGFFARASVRGATALYIAVTGGIYLTILSSLWAPTGWQWLADTSLHYAVPLLYLSLWLVFEPPRVLVWSDALRWLSFPIAYFAWAIARGAWLGEYPYPFIDAGALGYARVLVNAMGVLALFVAIGFALIAYNRRGAIPASQPAR